MNKIQLAASKFALWIFIGAWLLTVLIALCLRPLWLDELLHMRVAATPSAEFVHAVTEHAGATPVTYLPQRLLANFTSNLVLAGRLPSLFAYLLAACALAWLLARRLFLDARFAVAVFLTLPLVVRYGIEARPYSILLLLTAILCLLCLNLAQRKSWKDALLYVSVAVCGVYVLPVFLVVPIWHLSFFFGFGVTHRNAGGGRYGCVVALLAIAAGGAALFPWYLFAAPGWSKSIHELAVHPELSPSTVLMLLREITGGGYLGIALLIPFLAMPLRGKHMPAEQKWLWVSGLAVPTVAVLGMDLVFGYFLAIRQFIVVIVPLCVLAAYGYSAMASRNRRVAATYAASVVLTLAILSIRWMIGGNEDWSTVAAAAMKVSAAEKDSCVLALPLETTELLGMVTPEIRGQLCGPGQSFSKHAALIVVDTGYEASEKERAARFGGETAAPLKVGRMTIRRYRKNTPKTAP